MKEFVAINSGAYAFYGVFCRLDADYVALAANVDVAGTRHLFGESDYEFDAAADFKFGFDDKI